MAQNKIDINVRRETFNVRVDITFDNELIWIKGASGSGKTTILRTIAGLEIIETGSLEIKGITYYNEKINLSPVERRTCSMPQDDVLYPWLSAKENILFNMNKSKKEENKDFFEEVTEELEIKNILNKKPEKLSGGEKKRVSMARTLFSRPEIVLLDEPFSALNKSLRSKINNYICRYKNTFNVPILLVSHQTVVGAERIIEIEDGQIVRDMTVQKDEKQYSYGRF